MISTAALCGIPFFSGFFSKDEIIDNANHNGYTIFFVVGLIGAGMTAAYMTRATYMTFFGTARGAAAGHADHGHAAEEHELARSEEHELVATPVGARRLMRPRCATDTHDVHDACMTPMTRTTPTTRMPTRTSRRR